MDSLWWICWWTYEKERLLGQQSFRLSFLGCLLGELEGRLDGRVCRHGALPPSLRRWDLPCWGGRWLLRWAAGVRCPQLGRNRGRVSSRPQTRCLQSWLWDVFRHGAQLLPCLTGTAKRPLSAALVADSLRKSLQSACDEQVGDFAEQWGRIVRDCVI